MKTKTKTKAKRVATDEVRGGLRGAITCGGDTQMPRAIERARATFKYCWREVAWDRHRVTPTLDLACVKAPFAVGRQKVRTRAVPREEHMWLDVVDFDGRDVTGVLASNPYWVRSVRPGDRVRVPLSEISDWLFATGGEACGGYAVNLFRSRMSPRERREHDAAWGLGFGSPTEVRVAPGPLKPGGEGRAWLSEEEAAGREHPMSAGAAQVLREQLVKDPSILTATDDRGWTLLHREALAGSLASVNVLLEAGADAGARTGHGLTAAELAGSLGWDRVVAALAGTGGR